MRRIMLDFVAIYVPRTHTVHMPGCHVPIYMRPPLIYIEEWDSVEGLIARKEGKPCKMCNPTIPT